MYIWSANTRRVEIYIKPYFYKSRLSCQDQNYSCKKWKVIEFFIEYIRLKIADNPLAENIQGSIDMLDNGLSALLHDKSSDPLKKLISVLLTKHTTLFKPMAMPVILQM